MPDSPDDQAAGSPLPSEVVAPQSYTANVRYPERSPQAQVLFDQLLIEIGLRYDRRRAAES